MFYLQIIFVVSDNLRLVLLNGDNNKRIILCFSCQASPDMGVESVAVDRHVYEFVSDAGIIYKDYKEAKQIVEYAADIMQISRRALDYSIWLYMSNKKRGVQLELCFD